jgi:hypothetical protein
MCRQFLNTAFGEAVLCSVQDIHKAHSYLSMDLCSHDAIMDHLMQDALFISNLHLQSTIRGNVCALEYRCERSLILYLRVFFWSYPQMFLFAG